MTRIWFGQPDLCRGLYFLSRVVNIKLKPRHQPTTSVQQFDGLVSCYRDDYPMILVANKVDLAHGRVVSQEEGLNLANRLRVSFVM